MGAGIAWAQAVTNAQQPLLHAHRPGHPDAGAAEFRHDLVDGGCEPRLRGHIRGNLNVGNDKATLLSGVTQTLNAIGCHNEVMPEPP